MTDDEFLSRFETQGFAHDEWRHRDHLRAAYLYLTRHDFETALTRMRTGIQALNASHHVPESLTRGYHETLTVAWLTLVAAMLTEYGPAGTADEFLDGQPQLCQKNALRFFYSRDRIVTPEAKATFVEPDLAPLPRIKRAARSSWKP
jgi:hypothetical protein